MDQPTPVNAKHCSLSVLVLLGGWLGHEATDAAKSSPADVPFEMVPREPWLLLCTTPAGFPSPAQDDMEEPIDLSAWLIDQPAARYIMWVSGNSMIGAGIHDGDLVVVSRAVTVRPGDIVVALVHGERTMKRMRRRGDRLWLVPEADGFPAIIVDENVEVWSVVAALARRYRR